jgi:hypothetical protein
MNLLGIGVIGMVGYVVWEVVNRTGNTDLTPESYNLSFDKGRAVLEINSRVTNPGVFSLRIDRIQLKVFAKVKSLSPTGQPVEKMIDLGTIAPREFIEVQGNSSTLTKLPLVLKGSGIIDLLTKLTKVQNEILIVGQITVNGVDKKINRTVKPL